MKEDDLGILGDLVATIAGRPVHRLLKLHRTLNVSQDEHRPDARNAGAFADHVFGHNPARS